MIDLQLPPDAVERVKHVGLWFEGEDLHVRGHLRDTFSDARGGEHDVTLHQYRIDMVVHVPSMEITSIEVAPLDLPYEECFGAPPNAQLLVGERLTSGFGARAREKLAGELGCTHLQSLLADLTVADLFKGYIWIRKLLREGTIPQIPASDRKTGICAGWRRGGTLATTMESGRGIAPGRPYPELQERDR
jgi:DUF2889 family protein